MYKSRTHARAHTHTHTHTHNNYKIHYLCFASHDREKASVFVSNGSLPLQLPVLCVKIARAVAVGLGMTTCSEPLADCLWSC